MAVVIDYSHAHAPVAIAISSLFKRTNSAKFWLFNRGPYRLTGRFYE